MGSVGVVADTQLPSSCTVQQDLCGGIVEKSKFQRTLEQWIDPLTGHSRRRPMRVRGNSKNQAHTIETVYGCKHGNAETCPWGCYAELTCRKLVLKDGESRTSVDFHTLVPQKLDKRVLERDLRKTKLGWVRIGIIGDPSYAWDDGQDGGTVNACEFVASRGKRRIVLTRLWERPSHDQLERLAGVDTVLHCTVCAYDGNRFLVPRINTARAYLELGGLWVWRVVTFRFDDTPELGLHLWKRQDELMSGKVGAVDGKHALVLETPARIKKGEKAGSVVWEKGVPEWAYWKAPMTRDHSFSPHVHDWTAGLLYNQPACWVGCDDCEVQCLWNVDDETEQSLLAYPENKC